MTWHRETTYQKKQIVVVEGFPEVLSSYGVYGEIIVIHSPLFENPS